jgi:hypothetical protein
MLRHIISVSLAMTACASLIPTKANAISLTLTPVGSLYRNPGDSIEFLLKLTPDANQRVKVQEISIPFFDTTELSNGRVVNPVSPDRILTTTTTIASLIFRVDAPEKEPEDDIFGQGDVSALVKYLDVNTNISEFRGIGGYDVQPVPEPLTMLGAAAALGYGAILKRKYSKKTEF